VAQYESCVNAGYCREPQLAYDYRGQCVWPSREEKPNHAINCLTWYEMMAFARWVGARLPSEAEWEWAARSQRNDWNYPWGNSGVNCERARIRGCEQRVAEVCSHPEGNTEQGLCDMVGNLTEFTQDMYSESADILPLNGLPLAPTGTENVTGNRSVRGSSWLSFDPQSTVPTRNPFWFPTWPNNVQDVSILSVGDIQSRSAGNGFRLRLLTDDNPVIGALCGDGILEGSEECDDGNRFLETCPIGIDTCTVCSPQCTLEQGIQGLCGDDFINHPDEECDGQSVCQADCKLPPCYDTVHRINNCPNVDTVQLTEGVLQSGTSESWPYVYASMTLPQNEVTIRSFQVAKYEVSVQDYLACVNAGGCTPPACELSWQVPITICDDPQQSFPCERSTVDIDACNYVLDRPNHPINFLTATQAESYAEWVGFRLPSTFEWEYAAKSMGNEIRPWGNESSLATCDEANYEYFRSSVDGNFNCSRTGTLPVNSLLDGASLQGVHHLLGNVGEFVINQHDEIELRGGHFRDGRQRMYSFARDPFEYSNEFNSATGIRLVKGPICGDGVIQDGEQCDDGNVITESCEEMDLNCMVCNHLCELVVGRPASCGDGFRNEREDCDGEDHCTSNCTRAPCYETMQGCPELDWRLIEGGTFDMGSELTPEHSLSTAPSHEVTLTSYRLLRSEVTVGMYRRCVEAGACSAPQVDDFGDQCTWTTQVGDQERFPINCITWHQSMTLATWLGARLPTEAEWEFAARSRGNDNLYPWGDDEPNCYFDVVYQCPLSEICEGYIGDTAQNLCNMAGSVSEWLQDEQHNDYVGAPADGSGWCSGSCPTNSAHPNYDPVNNVLRTVRGGSNYTTNNRALNIARYGYRANLYIPAVGVRLAK
jgi:formylglycine-generating enzyme